MWISRHFEEHPKRNLKLRNKLRSAIPALKAKCLVEKLCGEDEVRLLRKSVQDPERCFDEFVALCDTLGDMANVLVVGKFSQRCFKISKEAGGTFVHKKMGRKKMWSCVFKAPRSPAMYLGYCGVPLTPHQIARLGRATERLSDRATERLSGRATERQSGRATERSSDRATERPSDRATER